jgi:hypothetical protein
MGPGRLDLMVMGREREGERERERYCIVLVVCVFIDLHRFEYLVGGLEHAFSPHIGNNNIN